MKVRNKPVLRRSTTASDWTPERVGQLRKQEIEQLRINAEALAANDVVAMCDEALRTLPKGAGKETAAQKARRALIPRGRAFEARGVWLQDARTSWGGVRKSDGGVVIGLWADAIESNGATCGYLLWAPNTEGSRPWSDTPGGRERLEHCKLAMKNKRAEALLVYGDRLDGHLPEEKARSVHGVDPETVVQLKIERRGEEYWAVWGGKA